MPKPDTKQMAIGKQLLTHLPQGLVIGCMSLSMVVGGNMSVALASETPRLFHIHHQTLTGTLNHIPLEAVLEDLKEQFGLEYSGPKKEMQTLVSGRFQAESLSSTLSSILAAWDYAVIFDKSGKPVKVFLTTKLTDETISASQQSQMRHVRQEPSQPSLRPVNNSSGFPGLDAGHVTHQQGINTSSPPGHSPDNISHMNIQPSVGEKMIIIPATALAKMPIIPASGFPQMEISPVSQETGRDFLERMQ